MKMNDYNTRVARDLPKAITGLEVGRFTVSDVQASVQSAVAQFENDGSGIATVVSLIETDLEKVLFTTQLDRQRPAAISCLRVLPAEIEAVVD